MIYRLLWLQFWRSRATRAGLLFLLLAGGISWYTGQQFLARQQETAALTAHVQQESIARNVSFFNKEMGLLLYYLRFALINETPPIAALSPGQRDVMPAVQGVTIRTLENQKYDTDLVNPQALMLGRLDFAFVLIYFFPLLIIAFTYNLFSEEKERGTWQVVLSQSDRPMQVLRRKIFLRYGSVMGVLAVLIGVGSVWLSIPFDGRMAAATLLAVLYISFWFAVSWVVVLCRRSSAVNAIVLLGVWLALTTIAPALVNGWLTWRYPLPEALSTMVEQREGYHRKWDLPKELTMNQFYAEYPEFRRFSLPDQQFSWLWYYAMQHAGDVEARDEAALLRQKVQERTAAANRLACWVPALQVQSQLDQLCRTDIGNHWRFLDHLAAFHEQKRMYFYPRIFAEAPVANEDWASFQPEYFTDQQPVDWLGLILPLAVMSGLLLVAAGWLARKKMF